MQLPGTNTTLVMTRNGHVNALDSQATRKFLHRSKETGSFTRRFEFFRKGNDLHLLVEEASQSGQPTMEAKAEEMPAMDACLLRKDKDTTMVTAAMRRSGDLVVEARLLHTK